MYRFRNHLTSSHLVLVRKQIGDGSCAALIVMRAPQRHYAIDQKKMADTCPPPKDKPKSRKLLWGTVGATMLTGAAIVYAKSSPEARNWLESNVPWANDLVALVYQENTTYWKFTANQFNKATKSVTNFLFGKEGVTPLDFQQRPEQDLDKDAARDFAKKSYELPPPTIEPLYVEEKVLETPDIEIQATLVQTEKCEPQSPPPIKITKDLVELEQDMHENTRSAIDNFKKATKHCADYNKALYRIVETPIADLDRKYFTTLKGAQSERDNAVKKAKEASAKAKCAIETLDRMIKAGVQAPPETIAATKRYITQFRNDLSIAEDEYKEAVDKAVLSDKYWNKVEAARMMYKEELQMLFPSIDLTARQLDIRGDTDLLLMYTLKQIQYLQNEIAELQTVRELKINRAIECHDEKAIIEAKVEDMIKHERMEKEKEFQKKSLEIQAEANRNLKEQLKKQFEIQQEVLQDKLAKKEKEVMNKFSRSVSEQVEKERVEFKKELGAMAGKLQAIEQTLKQRSAAEAEARRSQSLWAAAEALHAAARRNDARATLDKELRALEQAGKDDKLVQTVLKGIPNEVREKGIATEKALRDKFDRLERTAVKVALVGREGASLVVYFLSWLQSKLLYQKFAEIPQDELDNKPTDFSKLDTFDIIQRARYYMDHGSATPRPPLREPPLRGPAGRGPLLGRRGPGPPRGQTGRGRGHGARQRLGPAEGVTPLDFQQRPEQDLDKDAARDFAKKSYELPPPTIEPLYVEEKVLETPDIETPATLVKTEKCEPQSPLPIKITKDLVELEQDMHENTRSKIDNFKKSTKHCADYNKALYRIVEIPITDVDRKYFTTLKGAQSERDNVKKAKEASAKAKCAIEILDRMIKAGVQAPPKTIAATKRYITQFRNDLSIAEDEYKEAVDKAVLSDKYWNKVEAARMMYKEELQTLFPSIDLTARQLDVKGNTDLLLMYTLKQIQYLQKEIVELQTVRELKINRAIECHDEKAIIEAKVEDMIKHERMEKEKEFQKKSLEIQAEANRKLKEQLKKQFEIQQEVLQDKLAKKEKEVMNKFSRSVSEQVEKERVEFKKELGAMAGKLQAIEQTLKQRSAAEAEARRSQSLWAAAEALHAAARRNDARATLDKELRALEQAGKDDKLVQTVLKGIPNEVREKGIATERALRDKFDRLERTAVKVALVGREVASLVVYFLSWLQSKLLYQKFAEIPQDELDNKPTDFSKLDTFDIIQRARYYMDHGQLPHALRYVNLLSGAPRAAARSWVDEARAHLEQRPTNLQGAKLSRCPVNNYKVQVRDPCPPKPPPPPPKPKDDTAFWGAMTVVFLAAGFGFIAKQNPEIRDWLSIYAPWFDDLIAIAFQENMTFGEMGQKYLDSIKRSLNQLIKDDKDTKVKPCSMEVSDTPITKSADPESPPCEAPPPVVISKTACEVVDHLRVLANDVLSNYYTAERACFLYNEIVNETMANFSIPLLKELNGHMKERQELVQTSLQNADEALADIDSLAHYLECGAKGTQEEIAAAITEVEDYQQKFLASRIKYDWENDKSTALDNQWKRSHQLKKELQEVVFGMTDRVNRAFDTLPQVEKEQKEREAMMEAVLKQKRAELNQEYNKRYEDQRAANEKLLRDSLKKQLDAHEEIESRRLLEKEREATIKLDKLVSEKVAFEKRLFAQQLKEMSVKLKLVEDKLNARLKAESETRRSQALWAAGSALLAATKRGENVVKVNKELDAIEKASGDGDKLVTTVLKAIPNSVRENGVVPESVLRARYSEMEKVALKVALVEREGGPLPVYFLSWLMSVFLFMKISGIPQDEYDNPQKEPSEDLDTFDLLQRARFWLGQGNLAAAIRYVSLLQGASLGAAMTWRDAALAHLETKQAAEAVLAHATALGLHQSRRFVKSLEDQVGKEPFDHYTYCHRNALETICLTALGDDFMKNSAESSEYVCTIDKMFNILISRFQKFWLHQDVIYNFSSVKRQEQECIKILHKASSAILQKKKESYMKEMASTEDKFSSTKFKPFIQLLLELSHNTKVLTDDEIKEHIDTIIVSGSDTSGGTITYCMLLIGSYPHVQDKIIEELLTVFGDDDRDVTKEDLSKLVYLEAVIKESIRLYPTVAFTGRNIEEDVKLRNYTLLKGASAYLSIYAIYHHPQWGPDVEEFKPERWLEPSSLPSWANSIGFGVGRRFCIGI
ncbi:unnamed protein product [Danaus chrysippus]|uniref:MICOS complex subunit MIC60 n=1 Tax=Danaus chrysippus TaxID=151541 RepID=A0A8J2QTM0_9NEOP|nr:unnamed protein product [Danaus chrysippus]